MFRPDRRGHGRTPDVAGPITYDLMAADTIPFLEQVVGGPAFLAGHSDGAPVGLLAAVARPDLVRRLVFASGVFHHDGWAPGAIDLDEETTAFFVAYHGDDDEIPMDHTLALRQGLPRSQLAVVPGCGRGLFVDKPKFCNRIVTGFLTEDG